MKFATSFGALAFFSLSPSVIATTYTQSQSIVGSQFYDAFDFQNFKKDPTHGRV